MQVSDSKPSGAVRILTSPRFWLILLLLVAWALRLYQLDSMSLWWDEALSWDRATNTVPAILSNTIQIQNILTRDLHPPLYFLFLHVTVLFAGTTEFALRFLSAGANVITLALFVPLARVLLGKRGTVIGLVTVLFAAVSPFYVWYSQEARPYALVLLFGTLAVYFLVKWLKSQPQTWRPVVSRWGILFAVAVIASLATLYLSFVLLPFYAATILIFTWGIKSWRAHLISPTTILAALLMLAFSIILLLMPRETDMTSWDQVGPRSVPLFIMLRDVWNSFSVGLSLTLDQAALFDLFLLTLWLVGIASLVRVKQRDVRLTLFFLCYLLIPALALQFGSLFRPLYLNSRHLITTSPAFYLGLAIGVYALAHRVNLYVSRMTFDRAASSVPRRPLPNRPPSSVVAILVGALATLIVLSGSLVSLYNFYFDETYAKDDHKAWVQFLRERLRPDDYVILVAPQAEKVVEYYAPPGLQWESLPHLGQTQDWQEFLDRESVLNAYRNHPRVWLLELHQPVADPTRHINDLFDRFGNLTDEITFRGISTEIRLQAFGYNRLPDAPTAPLSADDLIRFTSNLELVGFDAPPQVQAGTRAVVNLFWRLRRRLPNDAIVSLRVVDENGKSWGQWDAPPVGTMQPLTKWEIKKTYLDQHDLLIEPGTPPGRYTVELNVYGAQDGAQWKAFRGLDRVETPLALTTIEVTRPPTPPDPAALVMDVHTNVPFGDALTFVGYDLEQTSAVPGSEIHVTLYFQLNQKSADTISGSITLTPPWWQFWNPSRAAVPFSLDLNDRQAGDIVQARVPARVPGDASAGNYDLRLTFDALMPKSTLPSNSYTFANLTIDSLARSTDLPSITHPLTARFGEGIELLGYTLDAPDPLTPRAPVRLTLYWRGLKPMDTSYKVFAQLLDATNTVRGQRDRIPLDGARPTTGWAPGEIFTDEYAFEVAPDAPSGDYKLIIGFYNETDFARLPVTDANGSPMGDHLILKELRLQ